MGISKSGASLKFDSESNLILFDVDRMIRLNKNKVTEISYNEILKLEFIYQPKGQSFSKLTLSNQVLKFTLENKRSYLNVVFNNPLNNKKFRNCNSLILTPNFFNTYPDFKALISA